VSAGGLLRAHGARVDWAPIDAGRPTVRRLLAVCMCTTKQNQILSSSARVSKFFVAACNGEGILPLLYYYCLTPILLEMSAMHGLHTCTQQCSSTRVARACASLLSWSSLPGAIVHVRAGCLKLAGQSCRPRPGARNVHRHVWNRASCRLHLTWPHSANFIHHCSNLKTCEVLKIGIFFSIF
jgi:hypothetical protein